MAFNRKAKLRDNIEAIRTLFELEKQRRAATPDEREVLSRYCGFGGLKCILNPAETIMDSARWSKSDREMFPMVAELHRIVRENSTDEREYKRYIDSLKSSVLTAFYTPPRGGVGTCRCHRTTRHHPQTPARPVGRARNVYLRFRGKCSEGGSDGF